MRARVYIFIWIINCCCAWSQEVEQIVQNALDAEAAMRKARQAYVYDLDIRIDRLDRKDHITSSSSTQVTLHPDRDPTFSTTLEGESLEKNKKRVHDSQKILAVMNFQKLAPHFKLTFKGVEEMSNRKCYVIHYEPRPDQPYDSREEKVINAMTGDFWIDCKTYGIWRSLGDLSQPVSVAWLFATVRQVHFDYIAAPLPNGDPGPTEIDVFYDIQMAFTYQRRNQHMAMTNYRLSP